MKKDGKEGREGGGVLFAFFFFSSDSFKIFGLLFVLIAFILATTRAALTYQ